MIRDRDHDRDRDQRININDEITLTPIYLDQLTAPQEPCEHWQHCDWPRTHYVCVCVYVCATVCVCVYIYIYI